MKQAALLAAGVATLAVAPLGAATEVGGSLNLHAGYGNNPFLTARGSGGGGGSALVGATLDAALVDRQALSTTTLSGTVDIQQNLRRYGRSENYFARLSRDQKFSERLSGQAGAYYQNTINPGQLSGFYGQFGATPVVTDPLADQVLIDPLTIGQRSQSYGGNGSLSWMPTERDQFTLGGGTNWTDYRNFNGDFHSYNGNASYLRTINARTKIGINGGITRVLSDVYPSSTSYAVNGVLIQQLSSIWLLNAQLGAIFPRGGLVSGGTSLGFDASLCGTYPRHSLCFGAARRAAPSGLGGLRTDTQFNARLDYQLDELSSVGATVTYDRSKQNGQTIVPSQTYWLAGANYSRRLNERFSMGVSGRYQRRTSGNVLGTASGYTVTVDFTTRFGRISR